MRLIDADAIIEVMQKCAENPENKQALLCYRYTQRILEEAPTVEPFAPWHRVEDGLPNEFDTVIACGRMKYDHEKDYEVFVDAAEYGPFDYSHDRWVTWNDWYEGQEEFKITHWMPLPEPPKEDA